jgi:hypothetical protein
MAKKANPEYLAKVKNLSQAESERLLSRMGGKLPQRLLKDKISTEEAMAIQLEIEDEQLQEWRKVMQNLREKETEKAAREKQKASEKASSKTPTKAGKKTGTAKGHLSE